MSLPKVSILIPCYNAERWIGSAIQSALDQTYSDVEVIIVDDGSKDKSVEAIRKFDGEVRWETGPNRGGNPTRNRLLELATGEFLQYLDADDYLLPDKVEKQVKWMQAHAPAADVLYSPTLIRWEDSGKVELREIPEPHDPWAELALWTLPQTGGPLWRRQALLDVGGWKPDQPCCQEHELYFRLLKAGKEFVFCPETGAVYRQWSDDTVCKKDVSLVINKRLEILQAAEIHLRELSNLTERRKTAINQARFDTARSFWQFDKDRARELHRQIP